MKKMRRLSFIIVLLFGTVFFIVNFVWAHNLDLAGKLLLQVEDHGRLWYMNPDNLLTYELTVDNYKIILSKIARGISNENLYKIALDENYLDENIDTDKDGYPDKLEVQHGYDPYGVGRWYGDDSLAQNLSGLVLLQIEDHGRLWYVNPENLKRYEITKDSLKMLAKDFALGVSNNYLDNLLKFAEKVDWSSQYICNNSECFVEKFSNCQAGIYKISLKDEFVLQYKILNKENGRCKIESSFLKNLDPLWENKKMTCFYDNNLDINKSLLSVFTDEEARCEGELFDLFMGGK